MLIEDELDKELKKAKYFKVSEGELKDINQARQSSEFIKEVNIAKKDIKQNKIIGNDKPQKFAKLSAVAHWSRADINGGKKKTKEGIHERNIKKIEQGLEQMRTAVKNLRYIGSEIGG